MGRINMSSKDGGTEGDFGAWHGIGSWVRLLVFIVLTAFSLPLAASSPTFTQDEPTVVRIGVFESNGFIALDEDDEMTGYGAEFMELLAEYAHVRYEYVRLTWQECLEGLLSGDIDIVTDARKTAERDRLYDFSVQCIGQIQGVIFAPKEMDDIYFNDYAAMSKLRIGFESGSRNLPLYEAFALKHGYTAVAVEYPSFSDLRLALRRGEIDAFGCDAHMYAEDLKVISIYNTDPNYIMAKKGSDIMRRLNLAIEEMYTQNPEMIAEQYDYLIERQVYGTILLTREEARYIERHPTVRVGTYTDRKPTSWYDAEDGTFKGIAIDMMERLSDNTGLRFEYVPMDEGVAAMTLLQSGAVDFIMPVVSKAYYDGDIPIRITRPLFSLSAALAFKDENRLSDGKRFSVAVTESNDGVRRMLSSYFENLEFKSYGTTQDCLEALRAGEVDAYGNAMYELEYRLKKPRNENLRIAYSYSCPFDYCLALREDAPDELYNILNSGISLIPPRAIDRIVRYHSTFLRYDATFTDKLYENRYLLLIVLVVFACLLAGWVCYSIMQRRTLATIERKGEEARLAAEEARRANAAKSDFLARMSHDMRTPMNGILGLAELSEDMEMSDQARELLHKISNEGRFLLNLINDVLDMSKIESDRLRLNMQVVDSRAVVDETLALVDAYAKERSVSCSVSQRNLGVGFVRMDKLRVQQIILNIMSNAVKFSPVGGHVELYVECYDRQENVSRDKFVIVDHGIGISPEFLPKIFTPFEQEYNSKSSAGREGSGLGMSIAKRLVDMMNGRIEVESIPGTGTTVTVYLDFERCHEGFAVGASAKPRYDIPAGTYVLLCEDNQVNTLVAQGLLKKVGCVVTCAADGKEGLETFRTSSPGYFKAVLMDIRMPVMDGLHAAKAIRTLERPDAKTIPILALTANAYDDDVQACLDAGMDAHIAKPIEPLILFETLSRALKTNA
jgi:signal transduction histidine kinase/ActR/RegA family two-component response regulator